MGASTTSSQRSLEQTAHGPPWTFYEGPPTANGMPGTHHVEARVFKDVFPRFKTMKGYHVPRMAGWDCHGLPVELAVEKELGFTGKPDIEAYGIAEFNAKCRENVQRHVDAFEAMSERMGYWADYENAYWTMRPDYVESVWWALKTIFDKGLLVEDYRVAPYCPRCGTTLSDHEVAQGYEDVTDPSVYVRFPLTSGPWAGKADLLVWTTTPWTLVSNTAVAVNPDVDYVVARAGAADRSSSPNRCSRKVLGEDAEVLATLPGTRRWSAGPTSARSTWSSSTGANFVVLADYVTTDDGTGLVHQAPAFGADDLAVCKAYGLPVVNPIERDGHFPAERRPGRRRVLQGRRRDAGRRPARARAAVPARAVHAQLPALLALPHAADVLRAAVLVRPHHRDQGPAARRERGDELVPGHDQARPLRRLAEQQHRLGAVARPLLGHAAAGVAQRRRPVPDGLRRLAGRTARSCPASRSTTRTARSSTTSRSPVPARTARTAGCRR